MADALPAGERDWLADAAHRIFVRRGTILVGDGQSSPFLYFPVDALLASWKSYDGLDRAACHDVAGRRRAAAYGRAMHWRSQDERLQVACSGDVWRLPYESFEARAIASDHPLRAAIARLAVATAAINAVRSFCGAEHSVRQRVTTFLISLRSERGSNEIPVTHETIAAMLSIRRPSVSEVLSDLQRAGAVRSHHGHVTFVDAVQLERVACACNRTIASILERVACY